MQRIGISFLLLSILSVRSEAQDKNELALFLKDNNISKAAKDYYQGKFKATDNAKTFSILDSIETKNSQTRSFYLYLATQMMKHSDGALSEELGLRTKEYLEKHPDWALSFLQEKLSAPSYISTWAKTIAGEIMIDCEGKEKQCVKQWYEIANKKTSINQKKTLVELYQQVSAQCP
jgi:hypothetical protein